MAEVLSAERIAELRAAELAGKLRKFCFWAGGLGFVGYMTWTLLYFLIDPPRQLSAVTPLQSFLLHVIWVPYIPFLLAPIVAVVGVCMRKTRKRMVLPLLVNIAMWAVMAITTYVMVKAFT